MARWTLRLVGLIAAVLVIASATAFALRPAGVPRASSAVSSPAPATTEASSGALVTFAVIGDYGVDDANERAVADLVSSWDPEFVIATGDSGYRSAGGYGTARYDESTGAYYGQWLKDITTTGERAPVGTARVNAFFPTLGNHDLTDNSPAPQSYLDYFTLPGEGFANSSGNERYYDFVEGPVHFFALDSNTWEPHGAGPRSRQARWLRSALASSTSHYNVVFDHHPPYSSDTAHGSTTYMRWPFAAWGADVVISGHSHTYERVMRDGIAYVVNGLGGAHRYGFGKALPGSFKRFSDDWGAQRVTVTPSGMTLAFYDVKGRLIDSFEVAPAPESSASTTRQASYRPPARPAP